MRAPSAWSVAVRRPDGTIVARRDALPRPSERRRAARIPFIRGVVVLGESLVLGYKALGWSAQMAAGEDEEELSSAQIGWTMLFAIVFFAAVFILIPALVAGWLAGGSSLLFNTVEGLLRLGLFIGYIWAIGRSKEIARVFEFHGAEHMAIHAYEAGEPLSVASVERYRPEHPRCGTSFLMIVVLGSIILFTFLGVPDGAFYLIGSRLLGIPVIAGLSYELLRFSGTRPDGRLARILAKPGLWLQKLTTSPPAADQIEVAIASLLVALDEDTVTEVLARGGVPETAVDVRRSVVPA
ncbi:MAG TPA: DUF1385 domain-containing protein [Acidimicrobiia bacterium]